MKTPTNIELTIMASKMMAQNTQAGTSTLIDEPVLVPTLKRKFDTLHKLNFAYPTDAALNDLITTFALKKKEFRWLDVEGQTLSFDSIARLQPSLVVAVSRNPQKLVVHNFRYAVSKINAVMPAVHLVEQDLSQPKQLLQLLGGSSPGRNNNKQKPKLQHFDVITCIASLTHFFDTEENAKQLFSNLASYLSPDGHLICVFRSGSDLLPQMDANKRTRYEDDLDVSAAAATITQNEDDDYEQQDTQLLLRGLLHTLAQQNKPKEKVTYGRFGSLLPAEETHTVQTHQPLERLVFRSIVQGVAASYGLVPVVDYPRELLAHFEAKDAKEAFKHFKDTCYVSVVFKKK